MNKHERYEEVESSINEETINLNYSHSDKYLEENSLSDISDDSVRKTKKHKKIDIDDDASGKKRKLESTETNENNTKIILNEDVNVNDLECINESSMSFANKNKRAKALLHANKYLAQVNHDEFPFRRVEDISFKQIDENYNDIVGKFLFI